jgi:hypothetical protein
MGSTSPQKCYPEIRISGKDSGGYDSLSASSSDGQIDATELLAACTYVRCTVRAMPKFSYWLRCHVIGTVSRTVFSKVFAREL